MAYTTPAYEFRLIDPTTLTNGGLTQYAELDPRDVTGYWIRTDVGGSSFSFTLPFSELDTASGRKYTRATLRRHAYLEIRRNGVQEFVGVLERCEYAADLRQWTIAGPDLTAHLLGMRVVAPTAPYSPNGPCETVIKDRVTNLLGSGAAAAQQIGSGVLFACPFTVEADSARGLTVQLQAQRLSLLQFAQQVCRDGHMLPQMVLASDYSGIQFQTAVPANHTSTNGAVPFAVSWANVEMLKFIEDYSQFKNHYYVAADGVGAARNVAEIEDASSVANHGRREGVIDAPYATSSAGRTDVGNLQIAQNELALIAIDAVPLRSANNAQYRTDWDVGWDVTFAEPNLLPASAPSVDVRIVAAKIEFNRNDGEKQTFSLGTAMPGSNMRALFEAVRRLQVANAN